MGVRMKNQNKLILYAVIFLVIAGLIAGVSAAPPVRVCDGGSCRPLSPQSDNTYHIGNEIGLSARDITLGAGTEDVEIKKADQTILMNEGGTINISAHKYKDFAIISMEDTGFGMTNEQANQVFDEFYKVDESRHDLKSHGLGLTISMRIVEKHGGRIWVENSEIGKGTTISFTLPLFKKK